MTLHLDIDGQAIPIRLRRSPRAAVISLRLDPRDGVVLLVLPAHASEAKGLAFARSKRDWLKERLAALPGRLPFVEGTPLPLLGVPHVLCHAAAARRGVWAEDGKIQVSGREEHFARRVGDWLKERARLEITARALPLAEALGRTIHRIAIRDPRSRWGSCSSRGDLAFSWRLVLAPVAVLDYVVAHEVAHLAELNHSPAFWRTVERLAPGHQPARAWLKREGTLLHRYG